MTRKNANFAKSASIICHSVAENCDPYSYFVVKMISVFEVLLAKIVYMLRAVDCGYE